jgi:hypothetical protein
MKNKEKNDWRTQVLELRERLPAEYKGLLQISGVDEDEKALKRK